MISRNFLNFGTSANIRREICAKWRIWQFFPPVFAMGRCAVGRGALTPPHKGNGFPRQCEHWLGMTRAGWRDAVPYTRFNIPSRRAGPACPAEKCVPGGGTHGSRPTGAYPPKKQRGAPCGAPRFPSMCGTDGGGLYSPLGKSGNRVGNQSKLFNRNISSAAVFHTIAVMTSVFSFTTRSGRTDCRLYTLID